MAAPEDLRAWISARIPHPARLTGLSLYCTADLPDRVLCLIGFADADPGTIADALRGQAFGFSSAVLTLPIGASFACRCRRPGTDLALRSCSCHPIGHVVPSWLDRE